MLRLGGPIFEDCSSYEEMAQAHRTLGYRAAYCPVNELDSDKIADARKAFEAADVKIAETGAWVNLVTPNEEHRKANIEHTVKMLTIADEIGAGCCVTFIGSWDPDTAFGPHPSNLAPEGFDLAVETVRTVIDDAAPKRAKFSLEMMQLVLPDSVDTYVELIEAVDRPQFGVHMDPVNMIVSPRLYYSTGDMIRDCFARLGDKIVSCHAKDLTMRGDLALHIDEIRPGLGNLDYAAFLTGLSKMDEPAPLLLEHLASEEEYTQARQHIVSVGKGLGLSFE
ncbi:hypothetical protein LCGC14_0225610 [marine sediment metagenome]|uniref:Xylose isomerase-like TIM barrel domain-containing protein n=1 Tax=marine sediment metagenome TaxID=412755 RepID=A0A0F9XFL0_9ZZZZ|nr:sugar phosphate isomerase/epimerase [Phycisphaerae bacterium]HDZ42985.1 sugar phosphate isomerase/epimerase [Phycisphaerae bacterium]